MFSIPFVLCVNLILVLSAKNEDYMGYKVYNVKLESEQQQNSFHLLKSDNVDYWRKPSFKHGVVGQAMVPPSHIQWFEDMLEEVGVNKDLLLDDVYEHLAGKESELVRTRRSDPETTFDFHGYYRYQAILDHLNRLQETYSNSSTISLDLVEFGRTKENRELVYIKIKNTNGNSGEEKPVIIIESGMVPREWITIPAALYIVNQLLDEAQTRLLNEYDWIIIPVLNPDGYEYTHTNLRLWTKSMSTNSHTGFICPGVHLNRNFDLDWSISDSSSSPCSHIYSGIHAFSEIETRLIASILEEYEERTKLYISLQNTGGFISFPWQYEKAASGLFREHLLLGLDMLDVMKDNYTLDVASVAYGDRASGTSLDYVRDRGVLYTFNLDIVQRGDDGVNVPEDDILSVAEDVWRAVEVTAGNVINKF